MIYQIAYEFSTAYVDHRMTALSTNIYIKANDDVAAVEGAVAFWKNRHKSLPEHFDTALCVCIHEVDPAPLAADGSLQSAGDGITRQVFVWKITTGCGPGVTTGAGLVQKPMGDMFNV